MKKLTIAILLFFCLSGMLFAFEEGPTLEKFREADFRGIWTEHPEDPDYTETHTFNSDGSYILDGNESIYGTWEYWSHNKSLQIFDSEGLVDVLVLIYWDGFQLTLEDPEGRQLSLFKLDSF